MNKPRVLVAVRGGVAYITASEGVEVLHLDYDTDGTPEDQVKKDVDGGMCNVGVHKCDDTDSTRHWMQEQFDHFKELFK